MTEQILPFPGPSSQGLSSRVVAGKFTVLVDLDVDNVVDVGFELEPGATVRDEGGRERTFTVGIYFTFVVDAGATDDLADDYPLSTINNECAAVGHHRDIADVDFLLLDFTDFTINKSHLNAKLLRVAGIHRPGVFRCLRLIRLSVIFEGVVGKEMQLESSRVVLDRTEGTKLFS